MTYRIRMTDYAIEQLQEIMDYISSTLQEPEIALNWSASLKKKISTLAEMPRRFALEEREPWHGFGLHRMPVMDVNVYFWIDETSREVWVTAVANQRRDPRIVLMHMPLS